MPIRPESESKDLPSQTAAAAPKKERRKGLLWRIVKPILLILVAAVLVIGVIPWGDVLRPKLAIIQQPKDDTAPMGRGVATTVIAQGEGLRYQWYVKEPGTLLFVKSAARKATYEYLMAEGKDGRQVYCIITDSYGDEIQSDTVTLRATKGITILEQPSDSTATIGHGVSTTVKAKGKNLRYQWYVKEPGSEEFVASKAHKATYEYLMAEGKDGRQVYCVITDKYGQKVQTDTVTLSTPQPPKIIQQPQDDTAPMGSGVATTVKAEGNGLRYQWYVKAPGSEEFVKSKSRKATYEYLMAEGKDGRQVYCVITDENGHQVQTDTVTLRTPAPLQITLQPTDSSTPLGASVILTVGAEGDGLSYQWYVMAAGATEFHKTDATQASFEHLMEEGSSGTLAYCAITDRYGNSIVTDIVTLTADAPL